MHEKCFLVEKITFHPLGNTEKMLKATEITLEECLSENDY